MIDGHLRIGAFSERVGVRADLLRAWERRYGLLEPSRSDGGFRLYSERDVARVRRMTQLLDQGLAAAEAARQALDEDTPATAITGTGDRRVPGRLVALPGGRVPTDSTALLLDALVDFDDVRAHALLDELLTTVGVERTVAEVAMPVLREIGRLWADGELSVSAEHFASSLLRSRLLAVARGWGQGLGPHVLLATPPSEGHDLGLIGFGLLLWCRGWRVTLVGADTPTDALVEAVERVRPDVLVLSAITAAPLRRLVGVDGLAAAHRLAIGGAGASAELATDLGATLLEGGLVAAADHLTRLQASTVPA